MEGERPESLREFIVTAELTQQEAASIITTVKIPKTKLRKINSRKNNHQPLHAENSRESGHNYAKMPLVYRRKPAHVI